MLKAFSEQVNSELKVKVYVTLFLFLKLRNVLNVANKSEKQLAGIVLVTKFNCQTVLH
jgi:hypothetical protein